jgi:hypothetical protein
MRAYIE